MARVNTTASIVYIDGAEFDGVYIVDGLGIMWDGVYNSEIIRVVQESLRAGKMVAAVGHGVAALCNVTDDRGNFIVAGKQVDSLVCYTFRGHFLAGLSIIFPMALPRAHSACLLTFVLSRVWGLACHADAHCLGSVHIPGTRQSHTCALA